MEICLCTSNQNKTKEILSYINTHFGTLAYKFNIYATNVECPEIQGTSEDIVYDKLERAFEKMGVSVAVEDTSLEFAAFKGLPGPYIKHFLNVLKPEGLHNMLSGQQDKTAYAVTRIGFQGVGDPKPIIFEGRTQGSIVVPRGKTDFGWDSIFQPDNCVKTYAEMTIDEKNKVSHRGKAVAQFCAFLYNRLRDTHPELFTKEKL
ncbi:inosine triphosphate pyrophosphatase-like [Hylaeus volcanicus]|uniref:inosine triphosphate pyrophosphatase-like n=1 Tax=Hylaeus volcanicus TaxID=313075 RepID=UPI0023B78E01|nr:inosine triphosphate pyrophosphatase-like [Hylaeus volcanicus]XP_053992063.1 inosine triphosphate pyrophosphatase-like [Hylaeus volcanicus]